MRTRWVIAFFLVASSAARGQQGDFRDTAAAYFDEIRTATAEHTDLWGADLYGPILLVRPANGALYANSPDSAGNLKKNGEVFTGFLPRAVNIANTALRWGGVHWALIMLPLPEDRADRINLLAHELFHRDQSRLGFKLQNPANNHLDQKEGRVSLRLELEALKAALLADSSAEMKSRLTDALLFRRYRNTLYPGSDSTENQLELNEGLAEYTGIAVSGRTDEQMRAHFLSTLSAFYDNPTYVRSFAYQTIPLYGYLLRRTEPDWTRQISPATNLADFFIKAFAVRIPADSDSAVTRIGEHYHRSQLVQEETAREERIARLFVEYKGKFIDRPHLEIPLFNMNISFDPRNIMPLRGAGTVYPTIRVTDNWGILTATNGALMSSNWNKIAVSVPTEIGDESASGDGWTLELRRGFVVRRDSLSNNYILTKE